MADVQFEQEQQSGFGERRMNSDKIPRMNKWLIDVGIAKNIAQANLFLIILALLIFLLSVFVLYKTFSQEKDIVSAATSAMVNIKLGPR